MPISFKVQQFEGPLDLLLQLVEQEEVDISSIALAKVAEQFMAYVNEHPAIPMEELADFLVVAAKLVYLKSKLLLPSLYDEEMEEGPDLETQLRLYREFVRASKAIDEIWRSGQRSFSRERRVTHSQEVSFAPPVGVTVLSLQEIMQNVIRRLEPLTHLPQAAVQRMVTVQDKIRQLFGRIKETAKTTFSSFVGTGATKHEAVASFLALLELVKQRFVRVAQGSLFDDIDIEAHPEAPEADPFVESFV